MSGDDRQNSPSISRQNRPSATVLDKLDEIAESCQPSAGAKITACADEIRDLLIGGN